MHTTGSLYAISKKLSSCKYNIHKSVNPITLYWTRQGVAFSLPRKTSHTQGCFTNYNKVKLNSYTLSTLHDVKINEADRS